MNRYVGIFIAESIAETSFSANVIASVDLVREVEYLLDLTGPYHNLLEKSKRDEGERLSRPAYGTPTLPF